MIRELEVEDIAKILTLNDNLEERLNCTKGEWIQFLMKQKDNPKFKIMGNVSDEGALKAYVVFVDCVIPPVFDMLNLLFIWSPEKHRTTKGLITEGKKWMREIGAKRGHVVLPPDHDEKYAAAFGGVLKGSLYEWVDNGEVIE